MLSRSWLLAIKSNLSCNSNKKNLSNYPNAEIPAVKRPLIKCCSFPALNIESINYRWARKKSQLSIVYKTSSLQSQQKTDMPKTDISTCLIFNLNLPEVVKLVFYLLINLILKIQIQSCLKLPRKLITFINSGQNIE